MELFGRCCSRITHILKLIPNLNFISTFIYFRGTRNQSNGVAASLVKPKTAAIYLSPSPFQQRSAKSWRSRRWRQSDNITRTSIKLRPASSTMVCAKCQKKLKSTELATPGVKRKNDMYYGSPSTTLGGSSAAGAAKGKSTLGNTGIGKVCFFAYLYFLRPSDIMAWLMADLSVEQTSQREGEESLCGLCFVL